MSTNKRMTQEEINSAFLTLTDGLSISDVIYVTGLEMATADRVMRAVKQLREEARQA